MSTETLTTSRTSNSKERKYNTAKWWEILCFGVTMGATNIHMIFFGAFLMVYATESYLVAAASIGFLMTATRILDAFTDPIIGVIIDKTDTKFGRFRPWIFVGSIIINISMLMIFSSFSIESEVGRFAWMAVWYVIWVIGYTFHTTVNKAGATILTNNPKQRPLVGGVGFMTTMALNMVIMVGAVPILKSLGGFSSPEAWKALSLIVAGISFSLSLLTIIGLWKKDRPENYRTTKGHQKVSVKDYKDVIMNNKPLQMLIVAASTNKIASQCVAASTFYFYVVVINNIDIQPMVAGLTLPLAVVGTFSGIALAVRMSNRKSFVLGTYGAIISGVLLLVLRPFAPEQMMLLVGLLAAVSFTNAVSGTNINPMIADITDYENYKNGRYAPGMISTAFSFIDKLVSSISTALVGVLIGVTGYTSGMEPSSSLYWGLIALFVGIPVLGHLASLWAMRRYDIDRELCEEMADELEKRKELALESGK